MAHISGPSDWEHARHQRVIQHETPNGRLALLGAQGGAAWVISDTYTEVER